MEAFATTKDLQERWRFLSDSEQTRAEVLLLDATVKITADCNRSGVTIDSTNELQSLMLKSINCEMVKRAMLSPIESPPLSAFSQTAGPYSESQTYVNPTGDLYMTSGEKKMLGIGAQKIWAIEPQIGGDSDA